MERIERKPFQGIANIIRFNRHFYVLAFLFILALLFSISFVPEKFSTVPILILIFTIAGIVFSLASSFYVYDLSDLYTLNWLDFLTVVPGQQIVNIHAGFDETSSLLQKKYSGSALSVFDFYDPFKHTEISIKRARTAYPAYEGTKAITTSGVPLSAQSVDHIFILLSAHEIRNSAERIVFFNKLRECLKENGKIIVVEHLRDLPNFIAYNIGFFHFFPKKEWNNTFTNADLHIEKEFKITPFLSAFILQKNGAAT